MNRTEVMITEQPDPKKPWGIGCAVCSRYHAWLSTKTKSGGAAPSGGERGASAWATFSVGRGKSLGVEDILRHVGQGSERSHLTGFT